MEHMGIEPGRLQFSWVSSAESTKFVKVVTEVTAAIKDLGPNKNFTEVTAAIKDLGPNKNLVKTMPKVA
jgi:hypothetical protein